MIRDKDSASRAARGSRKFRRRCAAFALLALPFAVTGCGDEVSREFRQAALGSIESGVNSIVDGLLDGLFAIAEPDESTS